MDNKELGTRGEAAAAAYLERAGMTVACIAAASVVAKVTRDALMVALEDDFPGYGFAQNKGYSTAEHLAALRELGPCDIHRRSFAPCNDDPTLF